MSDLWDITISKNGQCYPNWHESNFDDQIFRKMALKINFFQKISKQNFEKKFWKKNWKINLKKLKKISRKNFSKKKFSKKDFSKKNFKKACEKFYVRKNSLFCKIFESHFSENGIFKNWSKAVRIWLFLRQLQKPITRVCLTQTKYFIPLINSTHQDLWREIYCD